MEGSGAEVEVVYANRLKVRPCTGELDCWNKHPGKCYIKDSMQGLYPSLREADIWVLATPMYIPLPGEMQNILNRLCPLIDPVLTTRGGRTRARLHPDVRTRSLALVSTSGWWEIGNLGTVLRIAEEVAKDVSIEFAGALLRPHADLMMRGGEPTKGGRKVLEAAMRAGSEMAKEGRMDPRLLRTVSMPLISRKEFNKRQDIHHDR
jgi:multimeric flavodoxin WrbA